MLDGGFGRKHLWPAGVKKRQTLYEGEILS